MTSQEARLSRPSLMLKPLENKKSNTQYLFADHSCHFLLDNIAGTPRLHELFKLRNQEGKGDPMKSLQLAVNIREQCGDAHTSLNCVS
ncbi:rRNA N6-adenosine-methyltransferase ZCCHC4-like isoform X2 [Oncorhynchus tshawytscha]|uniref:rRNA N6-adenosine-methyltransferase ZCCHC4-like isoform X2 n=1 Tax=Oncorhynchus tshawytscha TaxID=74940 RepID=UPI001C3CC610|nr:rRNA N6-adenosine-methyltransferase ZCCHC4-like isoform X2 [Oncorhynchus tshawytscha]